MESLGEKLKNARKAKGYTYEQVSRETHISCIYLEAFETEDFSCFPGESYLQGFLRTYGEYLGLDVPDLLSSYRALKIERQPVPVDVLIGQHRPAPAKIVVWILAAVMTVSIIIAGVYIYKKQPEPEAPLIEVLAPASYPLTLGSMDQRLVAGESVIVQDGSDRYTVELAEIADMVSIRVPGGEIFQMDREQEVKVDMNGDGFEELSITVLDFIENDPEEGVLFHFELSEQPVQENTVGSAGPDLPPPVRSAEQLVLFSGPNPYPFTLQIQFQGPCMFRWDILAEAGRGRQEQYFQRGSEISIQAQNGVRLWASNAGTTKIQVIGGGRNNTVELGSAGEVGVSDIRWIRGAPTQYQLVVAKLD
ncbi:transcriptional regulator [Spirochaetia bacterium]|nr:transcriptional regulator [Spirochaetia bacterium]